MKKHERISRFYDSMRQLGFTFDEIETLRRAQLTLHRWAERKCNGEIERDEETGEVYSVYQGFGEGKHRHATADRETGALKRIADTLVARNERECGYYVGTSSDERFPGIISGPFKTPPDLLSKSHLLYVKSGNTGWRKAKPPEKFATLTFYHQTDPRGCALYIIRPGDVPEGEDVSAYYSRGIAVCI